MIWPFRKRKPQPRHVGPKTVDWKPGDWAECVRDDWENWLGIDQRPFVGQKFLVSQVLYKERGWYLRFINHRTCWSAYAFRKIILTDTGADRKVKKEVEA